MAHAAGRRAAVLLALWAPAAAWGAVIWYLSSLPSPPSPVDVPDYLSHAMEYGLLGVLVWLGAAGGFPGRPDGRKAAAVIGICVAYAVVDEVHQGFVPGRDPSGADVAADAAGAALAAAGMWLAAAAAARGLRAGAKAAAPPRVELLSRKDCHLCDVAEDVLRELQKDVSFDYEKVDVDRDEALRARYGGEVPVLLVGGRKLFKYRIDPERLRRKLRETT